MSTASGDVVKKVFVTFESTPFAIGNLTSAPDVEIRQRCQAATSQKTNKDKAA